MGREKIFFEKSDLAQKWRAVLGKNKAFFERVDFFSTNNSQFEVLMRVRVRLLGCEMRMEGVEIVLKSVRMSAFVAKSCSE